VGANDLFKGNDSSDKKAKIHPGSNSTARKMALICVKGFPARFSWNNSIVCLDETVIEL
jgi:hypothetical protein